jgi:tRNA (cytidine32/uridine32-2'-O)-methyltransferase
MMSHFYQHLEKTLTDIEFLDNSARRQTMPRLKRLFNRIRLDEMEVQMLRGILKSVDRKGKS